MTTTTGRHLLRRPLPALLALTLAAASSTIVASTRVASADPIGDARARAAALARTVDRLQTAAEVATEAYDAVESRLGQAVTERMLAQRQLEADQSGLADAESQITDRVRALYESGGRTSLLATVLQGSDPADAMARLHNIGSLLSWDSGGVSSATAVTRSAAELEARLTAAASRVTRLQSAAAAAATRVRSLLAQQQQALSAADATVRSLVAAQQAAAAAASAQSFADAVRAAGGTLSDLAQAPNATVAAALTAARSRLGDPYVWGATGPDTFDCSGLTQWAYAHAGVTLPRVAADQWGAGPHVAITELEPGDLLFWATDLSNPATIHHVALYIGGGLMIAAPHTGDVVKVEPVYMDGYIGATRPFVGTA